MHFENFLAEIDFQTQLSSIRLISLWKIMKIVYPYVDAFNSVKAKSLWSICYHNVFNVAKITIIDMA